jgi:hypothetical protein
MFTQVNFRCINKVGRSLNDRASNDSICSPQSAANRRSRKRVEAQDLGVN